jgi:hypothetical protein
MSGMEQDNPSDENVLVVLRVSMFFVLGTTRHIQHLGAQTSLAFFYMLIQYKAACNRSNHRLRLIQYH